MKNEPAGRIAFVTRARRGIGHSMLACNNYVTGLTITIDAGIDLS